jgi:hypothetical protein
VLGGNGCSLVELGISIANGGVWMGFEEDYVENRGRKGYDGVGFEMYS